MYYVFDRKPLLTGRWIDDGPFIKEVSFSRGQYIDPAKITAPLKYALKKINPYSEDHGPYLPAFLYNAYPLFRDDLIKALQDCAVNNLQVFDAALYDPESKQTLNHYKAVNIVGAIAAADMKKSQATVHQSPPLMDVTFDYLVIDPDKVKHLLMFRLAEAMGTIIVHAQVRDSLIAKGFDKDLAFFEPGEVAV